LEVIGNEPEIFFGNGVAISNRSGLNFSFLLSLTIVQLNIIVGANTVLLLIIADLIFRFNFINRGVTMPYNPGNILVGKLIIGIVMSAFFIKYYKRAGR